jgi:hypothetical protein
MKMKMEKLKYIIIILLTLISVYTKSQNLYDAQILEANAIAQQTSSNLFDPTNSYAFNFPLPQDFRISIFIDPCRFNAYNCCVNVFGEEYTYVCMYVCIYIHICILYTYMYVCIHVHMYAFCIHICIYVCICISTYV